MRVLVKSLLRKYGYPPDFQDAAVRPQMREVLQARNILIEQSVTRSLDHTLLRQLVDALRCYPPCTGASS